MAKIKHRYGKSKTGKQAEAKKIRRMKAEAMQAAYRALSIDQRLDLLYIRVGADGGKKERARLMGQLNNAT